MSYKNIACIADNTVRAQKSLKWITENTGIKHIDEIKRDSNPDVIIVLGGDGFMLHSLHKYIDLNVPFYGMNVGNVGFLLNGYKEEDIITRITNARPTIIHPLQMNATLCDGSNKVSTAINEVSLFRASNQAAKIRISVNNSVRLQELVCDGVLVATPAGSSAYNFSVGGSIVPLESKILSLSPISPFRPRRWEGALLPHNAEIIFDIIDSAKRPVNAVSDFIESNNIKSVRIKEDSRAITLLFDADHSLEERILREQFAY